MTSIPFEFPESAYLWAELTEATLESRFEIEPSKNSVTPTLWDEPDEPIWSVLVADWMCDKNIEIFAEIANNPKKKAVLEQFLTHLVRWFRQSIGIREGDLQVEHLQRLVLAQKVALLYVQVVGLGLHRFEGNLLQVLFASGHATAIKIAVDLLLTKPPRNWSDVSLALTPLVQSKTWHISDVFPHLLQSTDPSVLSPALDVANHAFRSRRLTEHPANAQFDSLLVLMGGLVNQLGVLEEEPMRFGNTVSSIQKILFDSVSLCVSLCDSFGLIGNKEAIGKLNQAAKLSHRRIRSEAAFALAKLGDKNGEKQIIALASDFSCRQRVIAYAEELGIEDQIDEKWTTHASIAESQLATWLAQNEQMGIAPARMELLDQRTLFWPGYEQPQECFLFRFEYDMQDSVFSNVGFAGPMNHTFSDDLGNIAMDDAYAMFAGWDIDHPDVYEVPPTALLPLQQVQVKEWILELQERFTDIELLLYGAFCEHSAMLARGKMGDEQRVFVFDGERTVYEPFPAHKHANPTLTYLLWRGKLFLEEAQ